MLFRSHQLSLGFTEGMAHNSIRIGMGRFNTKDEIQFVTNTISQTVNYLSRVKSTHSLFI